MTPPEAIGDGATRVFLAVMTQKRPTWRSVAAATGLSLANVNYHLHRLREEGLVAWEDGSRGTLHATAAPVPAKVAA